MINKKVYKQTELLSKWGKKCNKYWLPCGRDLKDTSSEHLSILRTSLCEVFFSEHVTLLFQRIPGGLQRGEMQ